MDKGTVIIKRASTLKKTRLPGVVQHLWEVMHPFPIESGNQPSVCTREMFLHIYNMSLVRLEACDSGVLPI